jgi:hypothetical protein
MQEMKSENNYNKCKKKLSNFINRVDTKLSAQDHWQWINNGIGSHRESSDKRLLPRIEEKTSNGVMCGNVV